MSTFPTIYHQALVRGCTQSASLCLCADWMSLWAAHSKRKTLRLQKIASSYIMLTCLEVFSKQAEVNHIISNCLPRLWQLTVIINWHWCLFTKTDFRIRGVLVLIKRYLFFIFLNTYGMPFYQLRLGKIHVVLLKATTCILRGKNELSLSLKYY